MLDPTDHEGLVGQIADLLLGRCRLPEVHRVNLAPTVLRRFDCVLTKAKPLAEHGRRHSGRLNHDAVENILNRPAGQRLHNRSQRDLARRKGDPDHVESRLFSSITGFSATLRREAVLAAAVTGQLDLGRAPVQPLAKAT
jgi:hypothetical protein